MGLREKKGFAFQLKIFQFVYVLQKYCTVIRIRSVYVFLKDIFKVSVSLNIL